MNLPQSALDGASIIELLAAFVIVFHACKSIFALLRGKGIDVARLLIAEGVLTAVGFSLAATLLKVIGLQQWVQIRLTRTGNSEGYIPGRLNQSCSDQP